MAVSPLPNRTGSITVDLDSLAEETIAERLGDADKLEKFRRRASEAYGGKLPASAKEDYARALLTVVAPQHRVAELRATGRLTASIATSRRKVSGLSDQLAVLEASNQRSYQASMDALRAAQEALARVLTSRAHEDVRVEAFFRIAANSQRATRLQTAWNAYQGKHAQFRAMLESLKATEAILAGEATPTEDDVHLVLLASRQYHLGLLVENLEAQIALLKEMVAHASNTGHALAGVQHELEQSLATTKQWVALALDEGRDCILSRVLDIATFVAFASLPTAPLAALTPLLMIVRGAILEDVEGARETAEMFVWKAVSRMVTAGLVDAGLGPQAARTLVSAIREGARAGAGSSRTDAAALVTDAVRGGLSDAQKLVIDFLLRDADESLPLSAIARSIIDLAALSTGDAHKIVESLSRMDRGIDGALTILEAAVAV